MEIKFEREFCVDAAEPRTWSSTYHVRTRWKNSCKKSADFSKERIIIFVGESLTHFFQKYLHFSSNPTYGNYKIKQLQTSWKIFNILYFYNRKIKVDWKNSLMFLKSQDWTISRNSIHVSKKNWIGCYGNPSLIDFSVIKTFSLNFVCCWK